MTNQQLTNTLNNVLYKNNQLMQHEKTNTSKQTNNNNKIKQYIHSPNLVAVA